MSSSDSDVLIKSENIKKPVHEYREDVITTDHHSLLEKHHLGLIVAYPSDMRKDDCPRVHHNITAIPNGNGQVVSVEGLSGSRVH